MFDFLRNLTKSAEEKQQEALNAYLDDVLSPQERQQFEQLLAADADLRQEVEQRRALQTQMRQMPRRRVPRNFTLDPAVYGRPQRQPLFEFYPVMRAATVLTALFFILALSADLFLTGQRNVASPQGVALMVEETTSDTAVEAPMAAEAVVEITRVITETTVEEGETVAAEAAPMMEAPVVEEMVESAAEEEMLPEASPVPQVEDTMTAATDAAEAGGEAAQEPAAIEPLPTATPAATQTVPSAIDATKSTVPRPEAETVTGERAVTAFPTAQPETLGQAEVIEPTAVPTPQPIQQPISGLRWLQIGLGLLLILLVTAVFYVRRQL